MKRLLSGASICCALLLVVPGFAQSFGKNVQGGTCPTGQVVGSLDHSGVPTCITPTPSGSAGGDVTGTYPNNLTVSKINGQTPGSIVTQNANTLSLGTGYTSSTYTVGTGGLTAGYLVSFDSSGNAITGASATSYGGVSASTVAANGSGEVIRSGVASVYFAGATTVGHIAIPNGSGQAVDSGLTSASLIPYTTPIVGVIQAAITSAGLASVRLHSPGSFGGLHSSTDLSDASGVRHVSSFANLPPFANYVGQYWDVIDCASQTSCTAGGGKFTGTLLGTSTGWTFVKSFANTYQFSALDYGADPTGTVSSQSAIVSALTAAAGSTLLLPCGTYNIDGGSMNPGNAAGAVTTLTGLGDCTVLHLTATSANQVFYMNHPNVTIRNLRITGVDYSHDSAIVLLAPSTAGTAMNAVIDGVTCDTFGSNCVSALGTATNPVTGLTIKNSTFNGAVGSDIAVFDTSDWRVEGNKFIYPNAVAIQYDMDTVQRNYQLNGNLIKTAATSTTSGTAHGMAQNANNPTMYFDGGSVDNNIVDQSAAATYNAANGTTNPVINGGLSIQCIHCSILGNNLMAGPTAGGSWRNCIEFYGSDAIIGQNTCQMGMILVGSLGGNQVQRVKVIGNSVTNGGAPSGISPDAYRIGGSSNSTAGSMYDIDFQNNHADLSTATTTGAALDFPNYQSINRIHVSGNSFVGSSASRAIWVQQCNTCSNWFVSGNYIEHGSVGISLSSGINLANANFNDNRFDGITTPLNDSTTGLTISYRHNMNSNQMAPTCTPNVTYAGSGATCTVTGNNESFTVALTTGTGTSTGGTLFTLTWPVAFIMPTGQVPHIMVQPTISTTPVIGSGVFNGTVTTTSYIMQVGSTALAASTGYSWNAQVSW